jgi:hypothetical protein
MKQLLTTIYGYMPNEKRERYKIILAHEINFFLKRIYSTLGQKSGLKIIKVTPDRITLKAAASGNTKPYEFRLERRENAAKGSIGQVITITNGINIKNIKKQRALFIAAEMYVYNAFANHRDHTAFDSIKNQNQYLDMLKTATGKTSSARLRDRAIRYVIAEIGYSKLAHYSEAGWFTRFTKLKGHEKEIADILGSSEKTYHKATKHQGRRYTKQMLEEELDLITHEIDEIDHLKEHIEEQMTKQADENRKKRLEMHKRNLEDLKANLIRVKLHYPRWEHLKKKHHKTFEEVKIDSVPHIGQLITHELKHHRIDINKIYILLQQFENEKINILKEAEFSRHERA